MFDYIIYIIAAGSALILGLLLKQPLLPEEPKRQSWTLSAIFPTTILALGFTAIISQLGYLTSSYLDYLIALAIGIITAFFSRYLLERILPRPNTAIETPEVTSEPEKPEEDSKNGSDKDESGKDKSYKDESGIDESDKTDQEESHG